MLSTFCVPVLQLSERIRLVIWNRCKYKKCLYPYFSYFGNDSLGFCIFVKSLKKYIYKKQNKLIL